MGEKTSTEEKLLDLLANKYTRGILSLTSMGDCSALQLCRELDIPLATVYRKLQFLENNGFIKNVKTIIHLSGNEEKYYRCAFQEVKMNFNRGMFSVSLTMEDSSDRVVRFWDRLNRAKGTA